MRWHRPPPSGTVAYVALVLVMTMLTASGVAPRWPGALHLVALPPLDLAADLRWLLARAPSGPVFMGGTAALLVARIVVLALLLGGVRRPRWRLAAASYLVAFVPLLLAAEFDFIAHAVLYSRLFGAGIGLLAATFVLLAAAPWSGADHLWAGFRRSARGGFRILDLTWYSASLIALGAATEVAPVGVTAGLIPASGALTWAAVSRLRAPAPARSRLHLIAAIAVGLALWAVVVVTRGSVPWQFSDADRPGSALIMSGINSASGDGAIFELEPARIGFECPQFFYFSYAGTGDGQPRGVAACPSKQGAPYEPQHTQRPFDEQVRLLVEQADHLDPPVVVLGHSQAAWVAWAAAAGDEIEGLRAVVLVGPFPSSPLAYPPPGHTGPGYAGGELLRFLSPLAELVDFDFAVDAPLSRQMLATADAASEVFSQPLPDDVDALAVTTSSDLALMPDDWHIRGAMDVCPVREAHPYLPLTPAFHAAVDAFLSGVRGNGCPPWPDWYRVASQAFGAPPRGR